MMKKRFWILFVSIFAVCFVLAACGEETTEEAASTFDNPNYPADVSDNPVATITMEDGQQIVIELEPKIAANTVANFIALAQDGFYDGLIFHRVISGFMIQGGDPDGNGTGGPDYSIAGEFTSNGFDNTLSHERGVISMARSQHPDSAGSQFFIMHENAPHLDGEYAAFGRVTEGLDVVDAVAAVETEGSDKPKKDQVMKSITVDTKGYTYPQPIKQ